MAHDRTYIKTSRCLILASLIGCGGGVEPPERDPDRALQTDRVEYRFVAEDGWGEPAVSVSIPFEFTNLTSDTIYWPGCGGRGSGLELEKEINGLWSHAWSAWEGLVLCPPVVVPPGGVYVDTLHAKGHVGEDMSHSFRFPDLSGNYRIAVRRMYHEYEWLEAPLGGSDPVDASLLVSNAFLIRR